MKYRYGVGALGIGLAGVILWAISKPSVASWVVCAALVVLALVEWRYGQKRQRDWQKQATIMWTYAEQLGYTAKDLQRLAGRYGEADWQNTRPENMQFYPSQPVMAAVIHQLKLACNAQEMVQKHVPLR